MKRMSGFQIMKRLIKELKPLAPIMLITIFLGVIGFLASISIAVFSAVAIGSLNGDISWITFKASIIVMVVCATLRGFLRYGEQLSGHYIAFKILYILRDKIFTKLRSLAPAKLEGKDKGSLIALITSDIELLEVFYAHTIAPISIAIITNTIIVIVLGKINVVFGVMSLISFLIVGFFIPYFSSSVGKEAGVSYRKNIGDCNSYILDSLRGLQEILFFKAGEDRIKGINDKSKNINKDLDVIKKHEGIVRALVELTIMCSIILFAICGFNIYVKGNISFTEMIIAIILIASSFGPVVALSNLSNTLLQTFASAERLFNLLDEEPFVNEVYNKEDIKGENISFENVSFTYKNSSKEILNNTSLNINKGDKVALIGESGIGKSTFIKLIMRFFDVSDGNIKLDNKSIEDINTESLRNSQALVSQETYLFDETIYDNIRLGNLKATREDIIEASKKAAIHNFIESLPNGYETKVSELGSSLSSGEKQRIGLARAFLKNSNILILDEPTSNLDTLNEGMILKSIKDTCNDKTIVLISHRMSTTSICNRILKLKDKKIIEV